MLAYQRRCAICSLRHADLLDAAHIIEDGRPGGDPVVPNGLALCKIHHAAYDRSILGISPDLVVHIDGDVLVEVDGPMLLHGLQEFHGEKLRVLPAHARTSPTVHDWPNGSRGSAPRAETASGRGAGRQGLSVG
jgi:putative restriction endonuclease